MLLNYTQSGIDSRQKKKKLTVQILKVKLVAA